MGKNYTDDELIRRVWDQEQIRNLIGRYSYYEAGNEREKSLDTLWVSEPENMATASFGRNWGFLKGMDEIRAYYVGRDRFGADGTNLMHPLSTKLVCEAGDGLSAQGIWMGIAYETAPDADGNLKAMWINERVAADLMKENGQWKIWHLFIGTNFVYPVGTSYPEQPVITQPISRQQGGAEWYVYGGGREKTQGQLAVFDQIPEYAEREAFLNGAQPEEIYTNLYNDQIFFPHLPVDYETFDDVISYDAAGFAKVSGSLQGRVIR